MGGISQQEGSHVRPCFGHFTLQAQSVATQNALSCHMHFAAQKHTVLLSQVHWTANASNILLHEMCQMFCYAKRAEGSCFAMQNNTPPMLPCFRFDPPPRPIIGQGPIGGLVILPKPSGNNYLFELLCEQVLFVW